MKTLRLFLYISDNWEIKLNFSWFIEQLMENNVTYGLFCKWNTKNLNNFENNKTIG